MPENSKSDVAGIFLQRTNISCDNPIEKEFYNPIDNKKPWFITSLICVLFTSETNVMEQDMLENEKK